MDVVLFEQNDEWQLQHRYMQIEGMAELAAPQLDKLTAPLPTVNAAQPTATKRYAQNSTSLTAAASCGPFVSDAPANAARGVRLARYRHCQVSGAGMPGAYCGWLVLTLEVHGS